ncbi:inhibitor of Bruton tyrosine kinase-like, partial [Anopheles cruzii]|uniref:inhibitor of Bruton tyrosine kinase-like n=1 Tax=Anopheles cruzii TaxID=68878 RepID=UPI0022EC7F5B
TLLAGASPDDAVHDVVLCVEGHQFAAHRFILYHRSEFLRRLLQASPTCQEFDLMQCGIDGLSVGAFKLALRYIYTNRYVGREDVLRLLRKPGEKPGDPKPGAIAELCNQLRGVFERLELSRLAEMLERIYSPSSGLLAYDPPEEPFPALPFDLFRELHDLTIVLEGEEKLRVHRCVLVTRLEYFAVMFGHTWGENRTTVDLHTIPHSTMKLIVTFLYDHEPLVFRMMDYLALQHMLRVCDQLFVEDLKRLLETLLVEKVNLYNMACTLRFACQFNCELVKGACLQMISTNLDRLLEGHLLESLAPNILEQIGTFYRKHYNLDSYRTITPFSDAIDDEELDQLVHEFHVQLEEKPLDARAKKGRPTAKVSRSQQQKLSLEKEAMDYLQRLSLEEESVANERKIAAAAAAASTATNTSKGRVPEADGTKSWHKVTTVTADAKRKSALSAALRANEMMKAEAQHPTGSGESFSNLRTVLQHSSPTSAPVLGGSPDEGYETAAPAGATPPGAIVSPISLADFGLQKGKLSQKQRKRLSSVTETVAVVPSGATDSNSNTEDQQLPTVSNPWKTITAPSVASFDAIQSAEAAGGGLLPTEASNVARRQRQRQSSNGSGTGGPRLSSGEQDFTEILADERRQKQYYEKQRLKSLTETQLEEQAIEELKAFYNVEQVHDEHITIERYRPPLTATPKVAVWGQRQ